MSSDLEIARARCSFDIKAIGEILFPAHDRETKQRVVEVLKKEKIFDHSIV